jgi:hypothetical protein
MVTHKGAGWPLAIFWVGVGLALLSLAQYVVKARRETK